ncbi:hypothetical protein [Clostridium sp. AM58-1XD]|uniref:hypothetical protein n=1 Tax=Clostridium sp. AM58-1XD TaxID=2292307 RepID=UPI000E551705|nr:hypothetical protein [Clostridium sp. AM58-1XD]RGY96820.1 hypothetical protein DXA13_16115 [Clostridium sp. AM58-1XD]
MKGKSYAARLGGLALALTFITTCLMGGTLARYTTEVTGTGSATVAKWSFKANEQTATFTDIDLASTAYTNIDKAGGNKIAPGTDGSFYIEIDGSGSEVAIDYTIAFSELSNKPANLKFYSDSGYSTEIADLTAYQDLKGEIAVDDLATPVKKMIYWKWDYGTAVKDVGPESGKEKMTFTITVTGTQKEPARPAT